MGEHHRHGNRDGTAELVTPLPRTTSVRYPLTQRVRTPRFNSARFLAVTTLDLAAVVVCCFLPIGVSSTCWPSCCSPSVSSTSAKTLFFLSPILFVSFFLGLLTFFTFLSGPSIPESVAHGVPALGTSHPDG